MRYYEIHHPYYAMIKAEDENEAVKEYINSVAGDEGEEGSLMKEMDEIDRDTAIIKFSMAAGEGEEKTAITEKKRHFNDEDYSILLIDGALV
ncbi:hypothetical protein [Salibacterium halotolerans]|uniref:Uncharacterized protein n=1 Tax=Salibacterium halotolerans TaxID=1884432 RepID=A0A1I5MKV5_9BACI|nr:hypothetical protein [Salibacterium halotolerans]SFP10225.1 hypothetical protein SAMN05518683_102271 [Salibacterium halotolerans]